MSRYTNGGQEILKSWKIQVPAHWNAHKSQTRFTTDKTLSTCNEYFKQVDIFMDASARLISAYIHMLEPLLGLTPVDDARDLCRWRMECVYVEE